jgi:hypothetical protein
MVCPDVDSPAIEPGKLAAASGFQRPSLETGGELVAAGEPGDSLTRSMGVV